MTAAAKKKLARSFSSLKVFAAKALSTISYNAGGILFCWWCT